MPEDLPIRTDFHTSDPDEVRELLDTMYGWRVRVESMRRERFRASVRRLEAGGVISVAVDLPATLRFHVAPRDRFTVSLIRAGVSQRLDGGPGFGRGDLFLGTAPDLEEACRVEEVSSRGVQLLPSLLTDLASPDPDRPITGWRFLSRRPVVGGGARWNGVISIFDRLVTDPQRASAPLVIGAAARLLAATALDIFPNNALPRPETTAAHDASPSTLQRAIAFIEANPSLDITVGDIARAAYVSTRAIQLAFRRQLDTTPTAYLRQVRLSHAHRELLEATAGSGVTITRVAFRWGFSTPSRFTALFRDTYGETPRQTLER